MVKSDTLHCSYPTSHIMDISKLYIWKLLLCMMPGQRRWTGKVRGRVLEFNVHHFPALIRLGQFNANYWLLLVTKDAFNHLLQLARIGYCTMICIYRVWKMKATFRRNLLKLEFTNRQLVTSLQSPLRKTGKWKPFFGAILLFKV